MAASDARLAPRKNEATVIPVVFFKNDGTVIATWTDADSEISQDYGQAADCTNEATEVDAPVSGKWGVGYLELTAAEMNCDFVLVKATITNTGALPFIWSCVPESAGDIRSDAVMLGGAAQSATDLKDFADTGYDPAAHKVQGVVLTDTLTTYTSNTPQTGDAYAAVGNLNDFDPATDAVANVTLVDTTTDLTNAPTDMATATALATVDTVVDAIKAKTDTIGASSVTVTSPVVSNNTIQLVQGDDYAAADSRQLDFTYTGQPSFTGGAVKMRFVHQGGTRTLLEISGTVTAADTVRFTPTAAETAQLSPNRMAFEIEVTLASGRVITPTALSTGTANILAQAAG